jgi:hypothetical protein
MAALGTALLVLLAVVLLVVVVRLLRSPSALPWPAIGVAALVSAVDFTVGGSTGQSLAGPDLAIVAAAVAGCLTVLAAVLALAPHRRHVGRPRRTPLVVACLGAAVGALGLLVSQLAG